MLENLRLEPEEFGAPIYRLIYNISRMENLKIVDGGSLTVMINRAWPLEKLLVGNLEGDGIRQSWCQLKISEDSVALAISSYSPWSEAESVSNTLWYPVTPRKYFLQSVRSTYVPSMVLHIQFTSQYQLLFHGLTLVTLKGQTQDVIPVAHAEKHIYFQPLMHLSISTI